MRNQSAYVFAVRVLLMVGVLATAIRAQETQAPGAASAAVTAPTKDAPQSNKLAYFRERLSALVVTETDEPRQALQLVDEPLITFENPVSQMWDGMMFVWTDHGRPAAAVKSYYHSLNKRWGRTFVALSTKQIEMSYQGTRLWAPDQAGLAFAPLPDAPQPADDGRRRLTQMRDIARRFTMVDRWGLKDPTDWQLRLLTTPLHRYEAPDQQVIDGAVFGYVANSPEALVLIEARTTAAGSAWHYAVSRFTRFEVTASFDGKQVAHFPRLDAWPATGVYFHDPIEAPDYPFPRPTEPSVSK